MAIAEDHCLAVRSKNRLRKWYSGGVRELVESNGAVLTGPCSTALPLNWDHLCGLKIESFHVQPELDVITADHCQAARLAIKNLRLLGYRRVGLALTRDEDARLENLFLIGYLVEHQHQLLKEEVTPFYFDDPESGTLPAQIENWIIRDRIDAVVSNTNLLPVLIQKTKHPAARHVAFGSLDMAETDTEVAGVVMNYRMVGERAAELLAIRMHTNQRGIPVNAATTTTPVGWSDGTSAPRIK